MDKISCGLTENEIKQLLGWHGYSLHDTDMNERIERINYLNKRLKSKEAKPEEAQPVVGQQTWGQSNG